MTNKLNSKSAQVENSYPALHVAPSPHISSTSASTRQMMLDVLVALVPVLVASIVVFHEYAIKQVIICVASCMAAEALFSRMRGRDIPLADLSAAVTGVILAMSLPATAPWYVGVIAGFTAIGIAKALFGGLGMNIFNPAMVGRAFVMISFAGALAASGYQNEALGVDAISQATPLDAFKQNGITASLASLFWGTTNGSLGETSGLACLIGGIYLCVRKTASWEVPASMAASVLLIGILVQIVNPGSGWTAVHHLFGGALLFGAFFIATDPVTNPLTRKGKLVFGAGTGALVMLLRLFSGYPEGVMFAVLLMNALTPLINQWTIPKPFGGK